MIRQFASALILSAFTLTLSGPALAGQQGDGHCPVNVGSDPDCAAEGAEEYQEQTKSSRDEFPRCRNGRAGQPLPPGCRKAVEVDSEKCDKSECRNQFPGDRSAPPAPRAPRQ